MSPVNRTAGVTRRTVVVHDRIEPPLLAGDYEVRVHQTISGDPDLGAVPDDLRHLRVSAPRYRLAGTEVLSTFPPANADGPFTTRLAQVALKRRTLPWERAASATRPWLALVLLTDGEGEYLPSVPVEAAVTDGVRLAGVNPDGATCAAIQVTQRVVTQVFPSQADLPLTCHVRQVPLDDTELAQGDDDGWIAVVIGTRLPRPGMRYRACLVSLEGQWDALPADPATEPQITKAVVYETLSVERVVAARRVRSDGVTLDLSTPPTGLTGLLIPKAAADLAPKAPRTGIDRETKDVPPPTSSGHASHDAWAGAGAATSSTAGSAAADTATATVLTSMVGMGIGSVILDASLVVLHPDEPLLRFPVLMSWEFRCEGDKDFAALVAGLDVGLLGTAARPGRGPTDRVPEVAETGHLVLGGRDRSGEAVSSWYRGPLGPLAVTRRPAQAVHVADQLRRVAEDGRPEISEAAAFELGRLLALSSPSLVGAMREWRRRSFATRRAGTLGEASILGDLLGHWQLVDAGVLQVARLASTLHRELLTAVGAPGQVEVVLPHRLLVDPLPDLDLLADPARRIADGLALPVAPLRVSLTGQARPVTPEQTLARPEQVGFTALARQPELLAPLAAGLGMRVGELAAMAGRFVAPGGAGGPGGPAGPGFVVPHAAPAAAGRGSRGSDDAAGGAAEPPDTVEGLFPGAALMHEEQEGPS